MTIIYCLYYILPYIQNNGESHLKKITLKVLHYGKYYDDVVTSPDKT
jgi:hypothetical protein